VKPLKRSLVTALALVALGAVLAHEGHMFAPHHDEHEHHCCLCDAAVGIAPVAAPLVRPDLVIAAAAPCDRLLEAPVLLHADASRAPPTS
jgi:hypothetical protein